MGPATARRQNQAAFERTHLARMRADRAHLERRKLSIANFGATWLKPPGVTKTLFQMREERREQEEHAEALRREQLAQELAEAEAEAEAGAGGGDLNIGAVDAMDGMRDLDAEIPDAEDFGFDGVESEDQPSETSDEENNELPASPGARGEARAARQREIRQIRENEERLRGWMARVPDEGANMFGPDEDIDEEDQAQMLEEDDLIPAVQNREMAPDMGLDMDMDADLDGDIPDAEDGGYEHTDTEAELSSEDNNLEVSFVASAHVQSSQYRRSLARSDGINMDISSFLSRDGSSAMGSSPQIRRRR